MDNATFNVRGRGEDKLVLALELACRCFGSTGRDGIPSFGGWKKDPEKGVLLYAYIGAVAPAGVSRFMSTPTCAELARMITVSLGEEWARKIPLENWDANADHDGDNRLGWRAYTDDWGVIENGRNAFLCVMPSYCWYGK